MHNLTFCANKSNDLICALEYSGYKPTVYNMPQLALSNADHNSSVLLLADDYPCTFLDFSQSLISIIKAKNLKVYVEYPLSINGVLTDSAQTVKYERVVISNNFFNNKPKKHSICAMNTFWYKRIDGITDPSMCIAKVAGYDELAFEMPKNTIPLLGFLNNDKDILLAASALSHFITSRFAPYERWKDIWQGIFRYLGSDILLSWEPAVTCYYEKEGTIMDDAYIDAFTRNCKWSYENMIAKIEGVPYVLEGFESGIDYLGNQFKRPTVRSDCGAETAMQFGMYAKFSSDPEYSRLSYNIMDRILNNPSLFNNDPTSSMYGLINWFENGNIFYGDDNARVIISALALRNITGKTDWDEHILKCIFGNLRTAGTSGFRRNRLTMDSFLEKTWKDYYQEDYVHLAPHYQSYLWAAYLWAYSLTGIEELYSKSEKAIGLCMEAFTDGFIWTNSLTAEISRMILPLCFLYKISGLPQHKEWLEKAVYSILEYQQPCGAIRDGFKDISTGRYPPPKSNEEYGTNEASLIQQDSDPATDLLYTANWTVLGLNEASYLLNDKVVHSACDTLAKFMVKIQVCSNKHPYLDGAWMRGFDYEKWEYYGSSADIGWGASCIESGWTNAWISTVLYLRATKKPLMEGSYEKKFAEMANRIYKEMITGQL